MESLLRRSGLADEAARARAQILYWAFLGFALSDQPLPPAGQSAVLDELLAVRLAIARRGYPFRANMLRDRKTKPETNS